MTMTTTMASMPETPGRGRSRFSKVLPLPPGADTRETLKSPALSTTSTTINSPLPPIPPRNRALPNPPAIPRRPIGMTAQQRALSASLAKAATSSSVKSPPATTIPMSSLSRGMSDTSTATMDSHGTLKSSPTTPPTPALPPKDIHNARTATTPEPSPHTTATPNEGFRLQGPSPPRPEIWRRRSNSATFYELKLEKSNGFTASPPRKEKEVTTNTSKPLPLPRSNTGNNPSARKPLPIRRDSPPTPRKEVPMGNEVSKIKEKTTTSARNVFHKSSTSRDESYTVQQQQQQRQQQNGPPTPEYIDGNGTHGDHGNENMALQKVTSPRSPDTPPSETRPSIPPRSDSRYKAAVEQTNQKLEDLSFMDDSTSTIHAPQHDELPKITSPPHLETIKSPSSPPPRSIPFPTFPGPPLPPDAIIPGLPLTETHFSCYHSHKYMRSSRNAIYSVACMTCGKMDHETRWRCTWCCLGACGSCMRVLRDVPGKDLRVLLEKVGGDAGR